MGPREWMLCSFWPALMVGICGEWLSCDVPVSTARSVRLSGDGDRLQTLAAQFDNIRLALEHDKHSDNMYDDWTVDIEYKTTSCLTEVEGGPGALDATDEEMLGMLVDAEEGYERYPGAGWFKLHARPLYWQLAEEVCRREGGRLAVADTADKVAAMQGLLQDSAEVLDASVLGHQVLIGVNDVAQEGLFRTSQGEAFVPWNETIWFPNEPNDDSPGEDCVTFHVLGHIRDVPCYYELPYICERDDA